MGVVGFKVAGFHVAETGVKFTSTFREFSLYLESNYLAARNRGTTSSWLEWNFSNPIGFLIFMLLHLSKEFGEEVRRQ